MKNQEINLGNIKVVAQKKRVPLPELAEKIGMTYVGLSKIIRENTTTISTACRIADVLNVPLQMFFVSEDVIDRLEGFSLDRYFALELENKTLKEEIRDLKDKIIRLADRL